MRPEELVERVWPGSAARVEVLGGGITNRNFKVTLGDGEAFVLRVGGKDAALLGIDRRAEHAASLVAAGLGLGPDVVAFLEPEGYLVTRFIEGRVVPPDDMREPSQLVRAADALQRLHGGPPVPSRFDSFRVVEAYLGTAVDRGARVPETFERAKRLADEIELRRRDAPLRPCHNDLLNANFLDDGRGLRIVDWEYAGMGDAFFDLANFSVNHELDQAADEALLAAYAGDVRSEDLDALALMRFMSDFREAMWGVVQTTISELDFDFSAYAAAHFERLERTAESVRFRAALEAV